MSETLQEIYLDWVNNYLSVPRFASDYGLTESEANQLINLGREVHERIVVEAKS